LQELVKKAIVKKMLFIILFFIEFALIFFLSRELSKTISQFLLRIFKSHKITIYFLSFLFLPGVIVHELAHWFMASILFVATGEIEFMPQIHGNKVKLGSVAIAKTDPIRRFFIGVAPILFGLIIIFGLYILLFPHFALTFSWKELLFFYLLFEIGNTMYSSSKDMEGAIGFFIIATIIIALYFFFHLHLPASIIQTITSTRVQEGFEKMDILLGILAGIDIFLCTILNYFLSR
jgi:hypothetical protein